VSRSKAQKESDLIKISELYLKGYSQREIASRVGVSVALVNLELKTVRELWKQSAIRNFDEAKAQELAKIDALEKTYWDAWVKSGGVHKSSTKEKAETDKGTFKKISIKTEKLTGTPAYLAGVERCIEQRCKLLGLYLPQKVEVTGNMLTIFSYQDEPSEEE